MLTPSRDQFLASARNGDLVPVYREILADRLTPVSAFERIAGEAGALLLGSAFSLSTDSLRAFDHVKHRVKVLCNAGVGEDPAEAYARAAARIEALVGKLRGPGRELTRPASGNPPEPVCNVTRQRYE